MCRLSTTAVGWSKRNIELFRDRRAGIAVLYSNADDKESRMLTRRLKLTTTP